MISIRPEEPEDFAAVHSINLAAFEGGPEADLVDALRLACPDHLSLVAEEDRRVVGHILFTPVVVESSEHRVEGMGLAPMAVTPEWHRSGVGSQLVNHGLEVLRGIGTSSMLPCDGSPRRGNPAYSVRRLAILAALARLGVPMDDPAFKE